ncbi:MAG: DNA-directed RNA polymerase subunit alpha [Nitrospirae bacterium]|nr:DNA-directed RNA polymerase subunit alpha [Nitrospirota bacterium]
MKLKGFQIPKKLEFETDTLTDTYGKFSAEPFERGFGTTIGNSLRRVLLSSLEGAAATSIKIDGVLHEFSSLPGVVEDITDIILNVKRLRFKMHGDRTRAVNIDVEGPGVVYASHIETDSDLEVLNPDLLIATLDKDTRFTMEMQVGKGRGYVPSEKNKDPEAPIGVIPVDSIYTPVQKVNYWVESARVGQETDYDKLIMEVQTDGSVTPNDAVAYAAKILKDHLNIFINFDEESEELEDEGVEVEEKFNENLLRSVNELELSVRSANCLKNANIKTIADLVQRSEGEMLKTKNFGRKSLNEIKELLVEMGLGFGLKVDMEKLRAYEKSMQKSGV